jgi:hypothetical protein
LGTKLSESQIGKLIGDALGAEEALGLSPGGVETAITRIRETAHRRERMAAVEQLWNATSSDNGDFGEALGRVNELEERDPSQPIPWIDRPRKSKAIRSTELVTMDIAEPEELVFPMLVIKEGVTLISGPSKVGKSILVLNLAHSIVSGDKFLRCHSVKKATVEYLQTEMGASSVQKRIKQLSLVSEKLWVRNVEPGELKLNTVRKGDYGRREKTPHRESLIRLIQHLRDHKIDCLIIDPIYELLDGSELDEFAMKSLFESLKGIARYSKTRWRHGPKFLSPPNMLPTLSWCQRNTSRIAGAMESFSRTWSRLKTWMSPSIRAGFQHSPMRPITRSPDRSSHSHTISRSGPRSRVWKAS